MNVWKASNRTMILSALSVYDWQPAEGVVDIHSPVWILEIPHQDHTLEGYFEKLGLSKTQGDYSTRAGRAGENKFFFQIYGQGLKKLKSNPELKEDIERLFPDEKRKTAKPGKEVLKKKLAAEAVIINAAIIINEVSIDGTILISYPALKIETVTKNFLGRAVREFFGLDIDHDFKGINHVSKYLQREKGIYAEAVKLMMPDKKVEDEIAVLARNNKINVPAVKRNSFHLPAYLN